MKTSLTVSLSASEDGQIVVRHESEAYNIESVTFTRKQSLDIALLVLAKQLLPDLQDGAKIEVFREEDGARLKVSAPTPPAEPPRP